MKTFIIILHYGDISVTNACILSLQKFEKNNVQVVVVNNNEEAISLKLISSRNITIVNNKKNLGFAAGMNKGISYVLRRGADIIFLLNNDTYIEKPIVKSLLQIFKTNPQIGIVGPSIVFKKDDKNVFDIGGYIHSLTGRTHHLELQQKPKDRVVFPDYISGAAMVIKKEVFETIGLFDEKYFMYYEDVDFCLRAKKAGFRIAVDTSVSICHLLSKSAGNSSRFKMHQLTKSSIVFGKKYFSTFPKMYINRAFIFLQSCIFLCKTKLF